MEDLIKEISAYIEYLKQTHRLSISLHTEPRFLICEELVQYNVHLNPYCTFVKSKRFDMCIKCQEMVLKKCSRHKTFTGECHTGISQFIYAIESSGETVGFVSVSGYAGKLRPPVGNTLYDSSVIHGEIPESFLKTVIAPLAIMLGVLFSKKNNHVEEPFDKVISFVNEYHTIVNLDMVCQRLHFSKSHISHLFRTTTGMTLKSYCNRLKVKDAESLLKNTDLSVTEIALAVGFENVSYFICTFKKQTGLTPLAYRKHKSKEHADF